MKLLIIEDDKPFIELIHHALGPGEIQVAGTMKEALQLIDENAPDVLVLDLGLPDSTTDQTLARIRELKTRAKDAKLIVISGYSNPRIIEEALRHGADQFLSKDQGFFGRIETLLLHGPKPKRSANDQTLTEIERIVAQIVAPNK